MGAHAGSTIETALSRSFPGFVTVYVSVTGSPTCTTGALGVTATSMAGEMTSTDAVAVSERARLLGSRPLASARFTTWSMSPGGLLVGPWIAVVHVYVHVSVRSSFAFELVSPVGPVTDAHLLSTTVTPLSAVLPVFVTTYV